MTPAPTNTLTEPSPRIWQVQFASAETMTAEASRVLLPPLLEASKTSPIVLLGVLPPTVKLVGGDLVAFWLDAARNKGLKLLGVGVLSESRGVRVAVTGFELAMKLSGSPLAVTVEKYEPALLAWAETLVRRAAA